jgi:hypothetical protein
VTSALSSSAGDLRDIVLVKHRYFRHLDLKEFEQLGELLTEDVTAAYGDVAEDLRGRAAVVEFLSRSLGNADIVTLHHGHHPEIMLVDQDHATGIWYLVDRVIVPGADLEIGGTAFYDDRYRRCNGEWLIEHTGYRRVFEERRRHTTGELTSFSSRFES